MRNMRVGFNSRNDATRVRAASRWAAFWSLGVISFVELIAVIGILATMVGLVIEFVR